MSARNLPFLLEIGAEEIPDWMIPAALEQLGKDFQTLLDTNKLGGKVTRTDGTGRRLVLWAEGLIDRQADSEELVSGPPKSSGEGAANGFARKNGVTLADLETLSTPKGEYFAYRKKVAGRPTAEILAAALPDLILKLYFPKSMFWTGKGGPRFIRPVRWIVALLGETVVPFTLAGVESGSTTLGHRRLGSRQPIPVTIADYEQQLEANYVIVSSAARRAKIEAEVLALATARGLTAKSDPALLETLTFITEYPTTILGSFDAGYLTLPAEVLTMVMRFHQKYFALTAADGTLAPHFLAVMNIPADPEGHVVRGNERVLRARFNDARFFYDVDQKKALADRVDDLASVTFQAKIGSYLAKTERTVELARQLGGETAAAAARLAKADLTTEMVKEFTDLQGIVGGIYTRAQGGSPEVAQAIYEHYKPLSMEDSIPSTPAGQAVALADKVDTLRSCFAIDMIPTGSKDPFALRRAAQGVVRILVEGDLPAPQKFLSIPVEKLVAGDAKLHAFFLDRIKYYFRDVKGYAYDEVNAVLKANGYSPTDLNADGDSPTDLKDIALRLGALRSVRPTPNFALIARAIKRTRNILRDAGIRDDGTPVPLSSAPSELDRQLREQIDQVLAAGRYLRERKYAEYLESIVAAGPVVDQFFNDLLVMDPDPSKRLFRLDALLRINRFFNAITDFSEIVTN